VHPGDLAGGFSDLEMTWLLYCAVAATGYDVGIRLCLILVVRNVGLENNIFTTV